MRSARMKNPIGWWYISDREFHHILEPVSPMATVNAIRIGPADHGRKMTLEEFREAEEEGGYCYELARGVLEVTYVPGEPRCLGRESISRRIAGKKLDPARIGDQRLGTLG